jgi:hypothetical protein
MQLPWQLPVAAARTPMSMVSTAGTKCLLLRVAACAPKRVPHPEIDYPCLRRDQLITDTWRERPGRRHLAVNENPMRAHAPACPHACVYGNQHDVLPVQCVRVCIWGQARRLKLVSGRAGYVPAGHLFNKMREAHAGMLARPKCAVLVLICTLTG